MNQEIEQEYIRTRSQIRSILEPGVRSGVFQNQELDHQKYIRTRSQIRIILEPGPRSEIYQNQEQDQDYITTRRQIRRILGPGIGAKSKVDGEQEYVRNKEQKGFRTSTRLELVQKQELNYKQSGSRKQNQGQDSARR